MEAFFILTAAGVREKDFFFNLQKNRLQLSLKKWSNFSDKTLFPFTLTHSLSLSLSLTLTHTHPHTDTHFRTHTRTLAHTHFGTHALWHTRTVSFSAISIFRLSRDIKFWTDMSVENISVVALWDSKRPPQVKNKK